MQTRRQRLSRFLGRAASALGRGLSEVAFAVAPGAVGRRRAIRAQLDFQRRLQGSFLATRESAAGDRFRSSKWLGSRLSPDSELEEDLSDVRDRARELTLNDPVAAGYVKTRVTNVVGTGMTLQSRVREGGPITAERAEELNKAFEALLRRQFKRLDRSGRKSLWRIQRLAQRQLSRDGEVLIVFSDKVRPGTPLPLCCEVIGGNRLATPPEKEGDASVRLGIERDADGDPVGYWIRTIPPDDTKYAEETYDRIEADRVVHLYEEEESDQSRGWPDMQPCVTTLRDLKDFEEAGLIARQIEACFCAFITSEGSPHDIAVGAASDTNSYGDRLEQISPGQIMRGRIGDKIDFGNPSPGRGPDHSAYMDWHYHRMAAGLNISHEALLKRFGRTNYSSARSVRLDDQEEYRCQQQLLREVFLERLYERCLDEAAALGLLPVTAAEYLALREQFIEHAWVPSGWKWVDPLREAQADSLAVDEGFNTRTRVNWAHGLDDEDLAHERLRERKRDADLEAELREYRARKGLDPEPPVDPRVQRRAPVRSAAAPPDREELSELVREIVEQIQTEAA